MLNALLAASIFGAVPAADAHSVRQIAQLSVPGMQAGDGFLGPIGAAGSVLAAAESDGTVSVFTEPSAGWTSQLPVAALRDPHLPAVLASGIAVSRSQIVVGYGEQDEEVFVEPPGGWHGEVAPSARLFDSRDPTAAGSVMMDHATVSGDTVFVSVADAPTSPPSPPSDPGWIDVFTEPVGGWSEDTTESARLMDSGGRTVYLEAQQGPVVIADASGDTGQRTEVFIEPPGGWHGVVHQSATLQTNATPAGSASATAMVLLTGDVLFARPAHGWAGKISPVARLRAIGDNLPDQTTSFIHGIALLAGCGGNPTPDEGCNIRGWLFDPVKGRWSGTIDARPALTGSYISGAGGPPPPFLTDPRTVMVSSSTGQVSVRQIVGAKFGHTPR